MIINTLQLLYWDKMLAHSNAAEISIQHCIFSKPCCKQCDQETPNKTHYPYCPFIIVTATKYSTQHHWANSHWPYLSQVAPAQDAWKPHLLERLADCKRGFLFLDSARFLWIQIEHSFGSPAGLAPRIWLMTLHCLHFPVRMLGRGCPAKFCDVMWHAQRLGLASATAAKNVHCGNQRGMGSGFPHSITGGYILTTVQILHWKWTLWRPFEFWYPDVAISVSSMSWRFFGGWEKQTWPRASCGPTLQDVFPPAARSNLKHNRGSKMPLQYQANTEPPQPPGHRASAFSLTPPIFASHPTADRLRSPARARGWQISPMTFPNLGQFHLCASHRAMSWWCSSVLVDATCSPLFGLSLHSSWNPCL